MREKEKKIVELDGVDKTILNHLSEDARRSVVRIAKEIGISATAIHKRIRKLEAAGVITGSYITFDYSCARPRFGGYSQLLPCTIIALPRCARPRFGGYSQHLFLLILLRHGCARPRFGGYSQLKT